VQATAVTQVKEGIVAEERLKIAVFIDFDNIQIGVKETLGKDFDVSIVLEALKERGEVVSKVAYADWPRASEYSREMTQHAIHMVQRSVTPRGDKNGADINLALDALEMAFTRDHINTFVIVGGDSDFMALVEKLKQYDKAKEWLLKSTQAAPPADWHRPRNFPSPKPPQDHAPAERTN